LQKQFKLDIFVNASFASLAYLQFLPKAFYGLV